MNNVDLRLKDMQAQLDMLRAENSRLRVQNVIKVIQKENVLPPQYEEHMQRLKFLEKENRRLLRLLEYGNINTLTTLIREFKDNSQRQLQRIVQEYQSYYVDKDEKKAIDDFVLYLEGIIKDLKFLTFNSFAKKRDENKMERTKES